MQLVGGVNSARCRTGQLEQPKQFFLTERSVSKQLRPSILSIARPKNAGNGDSEQVTRRDH